MSLSAQSVEPWFSDAVAAVENGEPEEARRLLRRVLQANDRHLQGWLWLAGLTEDPEEQQRCLERVLALSTGDGHRPFTAGPRTASQAVVEPPSLPETTAEPPSLPEATAEPPTVPEAVVEPPSASEAAAEPPASPDAAAGQEAPTDVTVELSIPRPTPLRTRSARRMPRPGRRPSLTPRRSQPRAPDAATEPPLVPDAAAEPLPAPEAAAEPPSVPGAAVEPLPEPEAVAEPLRAPEAMAEPPSVPDAAVEPLPAPETTAEPLPEPEAVAEPLPAPEAVAEPLRAPEAVAQPLPAPDATAEPGPASDATPEPSPPPGVAAAQATSPQLPPAVVGALQTVPLPESSSARPSRWAGWLQSSSLTGPAAIRTAALAFLAAVTVAELLVTFVDARLGLALHCILLVGILFGSTRVGDGPGRALLVSLAFAPLIRIMSLSLPLTRFPVLYWYLLTSVPLFAALFVTAPMLGYSWRDLGLNLRKLPFQATIALSGLLFGELEYLILRPEPLAISLNWSQIWWPALVLTVCTGLLEEMIFRGLQQRVAGEALGRWGMAYVALLFAVLHLGYQSLLDVLFVLVVGLFLGWAVQRSRSLLGVTVAHGLTNCMLFLIMPFLLGS